MEELSERVDLPVERIEEVVKLTQEPISLELTVGSKEDTSLEHYITNEDAVSPEEAVIDSLLHDQIERVMKILTDREQMVIKLRFGLDDGIPRSLEEIGRILGVTRERIRQVEEKALNKLRANSPQKLREYYNKE
jgi:RNA polymerase primary sigma factor